MLALDTFIFGRTCTGAHARTLFCVSHFLCFSLHEIYAYLFPNEISLMRFEHVWVESWAFIGHKRAGPGFAESVCFLVLKVNLPTKSVSASICRYM